MNIKQEREYLQQLLEEGQLNSLSVQVIALNRFANSIGYIAVGNDPRRGFVSYDHKTWNTTNYISLQNMQYKYNHTINPKVGKWFVTEEEKKKKDENSIVTKISLQYNKKLGKLTSELHWLKFVKED